MPVDDYVQAKVCGVLYALVDQALKLFLIAAGAVAVVFLRVHGQADTVDAPVIPECLKCIWIYVLREPVDSVSADALEGD